MLCNNNMRDALQLVSPHLILRGYLFDRDPAEVRPMVDWLRDHLPARVRAPGEAVSYSNYGVVLAGLVVQDVSGIPFNEYVETHIFQPLQMQHTTFREPLGPEHPMPYPPSSRRSLQSGM